MVLVLKGRIAPLDRDAPDAVFKGRVYIDDGGSVERVTPEGASAPTGFTAAPVLDAGDNFVLPGFIDLHNHIGFNTLPLWTEPTQKVPFAHHDSWPRAKSYSPSISWPANALVQAAPEAVLAYVQLRALVGGTSAIQGWPLANRRHVQVLRNVDDETVGTTNHELIITSALTKTPIELAKVAQAQKNGAGFIYHCAEGQQGTIVAREFADAANAGCLTKTFVGVHCSAVAAGDWSRWSKSQGGALAWSPFSNLWLYGSTTDVKSAMKQDVAVCLGSDWGPSGTKNIQGEIKVAKLASTKFGYGFKDKDLVKMITANPGDALARAWNKSAGRLSAGAFGDVTVIRAGGSAPVWKRVVESTERDVLLVVYNGIPRYGDPALMTAAGLPKSSEITIGGKKRRFAIPNPAKPNEPWTWTAIADALATVRKDPAKALQHADAQRRAFAGRMDADDAPLTLVLDMPTGGLPIAGDVSKHAKDIVIPPLPSLVHDAAFFKSIKGHGFHGGLLDGLAAFYT